MPVPSIRLVVGACLLWLGVSASALAQSGSMSGTWIGNVAQNEGSSGYSVVLTFSAKGAASHYPELNCRGRLTRAGTANGYVFFSEVITEGRDQCIDGSMTVKITGSILAWGWVGVDEPTGEVIVAWSNMIRK